MFHGQCVLSFFGHAHFASLPSGQGNVGHVLFADGIVAFASGAIEIDAFVAAIVFLTNIEVVACSNVAYAEGVERPFIGVGISIIVLHWHRSNARTACPYHLVHRVCLRPYFAVDKVSARRCGYFRIDSHYVTRQHLVLVADAVSLNHLDLIRVAAVVGDTECTWRIVSALLRHEAAHIDFVG